MKDVAPGNRFFVGMFLAGFVLALLTYRGIMPSIIRLGFFCVFIGGVAAVGSSGLVEMISKDCGSWKQARSYFAWSVLYVLVFIVFLMLPKAWIPPKPCHPKCRWCAEIIEDWKEDARQDYYENRHP